MKVLANDGLNEEGIKLFKEAGIEVDAEKKNTDELVNVVGEYDALLVRSATKVTEDIIEAGAKGNLKIIGRAGVGVDNIDVDAASKHGVLVKFAPYGNTNAAAEIALGLMLAVSRNLSQAHHSLKKGVWQKKQFKGTELSHKTLGIIGCGRIGQRLSQLVRGFDMKVVGYDAFSEHVKSSFPESSVEYMPMEEVLKTADYISIHTGGKDVVIGEKEISLMKKTAYLINASRHHNIDNEALYNALKEGKIAGAGIDVHENEPKKELEKFESRFNDMENVAMTSHLGASTKEAGKKTAVEMAEVTISYLLRGNFNNAVNAGESIEAEETPVYPLFLYHQDKPGVFAKVNKILGDNGINIRELPSRQLGKGGAAITVCLVNQKVKPEIIEQLRGIEEVNNVKG